MLLLLTGLTSVVTLTVNAAGAISVDSLLSVLLLLLRRITFVYGVNLHHRLTVHVYMWGISIDHNIYYQTHKREAA